MPRYVRDGHIIFASNRAYKTIYEEQGYLPLKEEKTEEDKKDVEEEQEKSLAPQSTLEEDNVDDQDDYGDEEENEGPGTVSLDPNDSVPLAARVAMLSYDELKAKAKELGIPKYANTKRDELVDLIVEKLEAPND